MTMIMTSLLRRRNAVPAAILAGAAAAGFLLLAPRAPPRAALRDDFPARELRARRSLERKRKPNGEYIHYPAFDEDRRDALREPLPCDDDDPKEVRWYRDIDYQQPGLCGGAKCFFRSLCHPEEGYLVHAGAEDLSYHVAKDLEETYGIKHFYAAPPFKSGWSTRPFVNRLTGGYVAFYEGAEDLVVQPMVAAPEGSAVLRCRGPRWYWLTSRLEQVLDGTKKSAKRRFIGDLERTAELVKARPELINDFQIMVDPEGNVYHLDFDRMQRGMPSKRMKQVFEDCLEDAVVFVRALKNDDEDSEAELMEKFDEWNLKRYGPNKAKLWKGPIFGF